MPWKSINHPVNELDMTRMECDYHSANIGPPQLDDKATFMSLTI
jgi:hypothetical protein